MADAIASSSRRCAPPRRARSPGETALTEAVARYYFKLLAYKDEYEVARLFTSGAFQKQVEASFEGEKLRYTFHLAPPILGRKDKTTGLPKKTSFGPWMMQAFGLLAKLKGLRGTAFDPFGYSTERKTERRLIADYEQPLRRRSSRSSSRETMRSPSRSPPFRRKFADTAM